MRRIVLALLLTQPAFAHVISISSGTVALEGRNLEYRLQIPSYETSQIATPERAIFDHISFSSGFETARAATRECHADQANLVCSARYEFTAPPERLAVKCTFYEITVSNHIHMLRATRGAQSDQAILDSGFPTATLAFRPPTATETALRDSSSGLVRVFSSAAQILLLAALVLAARTNRELLVFGLAFLAGEVLGALGMLHLNWQPTPRFTEAAAALGLACLSVETVAFPKSQGRWLLALVFGVFAGMYFAIFINESGYNAAWVLTGAGLAGVLTLAAAAIISYGLRRVLLLDRWRIHLTRLASIVLIITGAVWFTLRLRG